MEDFRLHGTLGKDPHQLVYASSNPSAPYRVMNILTGGLQNIPSTTPGIVPFGETDAPGLEKLRNQYQTDYGFDPVLGMYTRPFFIRNARGMVGRTQFDPKENTWVTQWQNGHKQVLGTTDAAQEARRMAQAAEYIQKQKGSYASWNPKWEQYWGNASRTVEAKRVQLQALLQSHPEYRLFLNANSPEAFQRNWSAVMEGKKPLSGNSLSRAYTIFRNHADKGILAKRGWSPEAIARGHQLFLRQIPNTEMKTPDTFEGEAGRNYQSRMAEIRRRLDYGDPQNTAFLTAERRRLGNAYAAWTRRNRNSGAEVRESHAQPSVMTAEAVKPKTTASALRGMSKDRFQTIGAEARAGASPRYRYYGA